MHPTRIPMIHYQMTETFLNYREILIVRANNLLLRDSTNGVTGHGRLACSARHRPISKTENPRIRLI